MKWIFLLFTILFFIIWLFLKTDIMAFLCGISIALFFVSFIDDDTKRYF